MLISIHLYVCVYKYSYSYSGFGVYLFTRYMDTKQSPPLPLS